MAREVLGPGVQVSTRSRSKPWWRDCASLGHVRSFDGAGAFCIYCSDMAKRHPYKINVDLTFAPLEDPKFIVSDLKEHETWWFNHPSFFSNRAISICPPHLLKGITK